METPDLDPEIPSPTKLHLHPLRAVLILLASLTLVWVFIHHRADSPDLSSSAPQPESVEQTSKPPLVVDLSPPEPAGLIFSAPTPQTQWDQIDNPKVYMPTGSGRVESAGYGSVRTNSQGRASFHEGVDIAPTQWTSHRRAADSIFAVADGRVAYISRAAGNSSYGIYVVLTHDDPLGKVLTLYAHLASVPKSLKTGAPVSRGDVIGTMGHTSTLGIPVQRSHLHFEMGIQLNSNFKGFYNSRKLSNPHGNWHGFNLAGFNPHLLLNSLASHDSTIFSYLRTLQRKPPAWQVVLKTTSKPDYFNRYPALWTDSPATGSAIVLDVSESGIPLHGRFATAEETRSLGDESYRVTEVNTEILGRNGLRHVIRTNGKWTLGSNGIRWKDILLY